MENIVCTKKVELVVEVTVESNCVVVWARLGLGKLGEEPGVSLVEWVPVGEDAEREALRLQDQFIARIKSRLERAVHLESNKGGDQRIAERALDAATVAQLIDGKVAA